MWNNLLGGKNVHEPIYCKVSSFSKIHSPKLFGISGSDFHRKLKLLCSLVIQRAYFSSLDSYLKAYANETKHVNKDSPIHILNSFIFINYHLGSWWTIGATINVIFFLFSQLQSLSLPSHWMTQFFQAHVAIELQSYEEGLERYSNLSQAGFSKNKYILLQTALAQYHARGVVLSIQYTE